MKERGEVRYGKHVHFDPTDLSTVTSMMESCPIKVVECIDISPAWNGVRVDSL
jgi:hypothetical protein